MAYIIYWARLKAHDDPYSEGYVGLTANGLDVRKKSHYKTAKSSRKRNVHFHNALLKYGSRVIWEILHLDLTEQEAFDLEGIYREDINVGWNTDRGGVKAVSSEWYENEANSEMHSQATAIATRQRIHEVDSPEARAARARKVWLDEDYRKSREGMFAGELNPQYGKFGENHPAHGHTKTPEGRAAISAAQKGKIVSADTRALISEAKSKVSDEVRAEMYDKRMKGEQPKKIARDYGFNSAYVIKQIRYWREKNGLLEPPPIIEWEVSGKEMARLTARGEKAMASKFTDVQRRDICERRAQDESYKSIGDSYHKGVSTIANICREWGPKNGYPFNKVVAERKQKLTKKQKIEMCQRRKNGETFEEIAKDYDANYQSVHYVCSKWGPLNGFPFLKTHG